MLDSLNDADSEIKEIETDRVSGYPPARDVQVLEPTTHDAVPTIPMHPEKIAAKVCTI
jgi:hypothetical protein